LSASVQVRPVRSTDFPQWQVLWDGYNAFYGRSGDTAATAGRYPNDLVAFLRQRRAHACARRGSRARLVGLTHFLYHRSTIQIPPTCYLADLFTADAVRGQGVGRALIAAVYEHARARRLATRLLADA